MYHPAFLVFGIVVAIMGVIQFLTRGWQGNYAHQAWKSFGIEGMARTPEFWAKASIPFTIVVVVIGAGFVVASFLPS